MIPRNVVFYKILLNASLHSKRIVSDGLVDDAGDAEHNDGCSADDEGGTGVVVRTEGSDGGVALVDVYGLDYT